MNRNTSLALSMFALAAGMVMLAYAAVPLYRIFCQVTGFGGTPKVVETASMHVLDRDITVQFNADVAPDLPWTFAPQERRVRLKIGENRLTAYHVENKADHAVSGHATYNVLPEEAGAYFSKIECFCFTEQTLRAREVVNMPISFYIDPRIVEDPALADIRTITLSYTFFLSKNGAN